MGMYTEFHFNSELKKDTPNNVIEILRYMIGSSPKPERLPEHELFFTERWWYMLVSTSTYFDAETISTLKFDNVIGSYFLCIRCNLKNYDQEIQHFIDWIDPYLDKYEGNFLGFYRYEEDEEPTLIYKK
jgi:hypothetical protein